MKLLTMQASPASHHFLPHGIHLILKTALHLFTHDACLLHMQKGKGKVVPVLH
jgi:hypothetical protein